MTIDEQTAMQMGYYALKRAIERIRVLLEYTFDSEESEAQVGSERNALAMMAKVLEAGNAEKSDDWQEIYTASKDAPRLRLWIPTLANNEFGDCRQQHGAWHLDKYAAKPRPHWRYTSLFGERIIRNHQPTHWMPLPAPPNGPK